MFMKNCWYVAGWSHEVEADALFARTICNKRIVFWRDEAGRLHALDDRCCHRGAPLSIGRKEGNAVRCMYHGFLFDTSGTCIEIPGYAQIPPKARVRSYAVVERSRWIWLWMGDPAQADESLIPDTHWLDDPDWACTQPGRLHYDVNYQLVNDNLLDFSHLSYVHPKTLGGSEEYAQLRSKIERLPRGLRITRWFLDKPPAPFVAKLLQAKGMTGNVDRWNNYDFLLPGVLIMDSGFAPAGSGAQEGNRKDGIEFRHCQVVTPETENTCHYFFAQPRNFDKDSLDVSQALYTSILAAFEEDRGIITAQAENIAAEPSFEPVACGLDAALGQFRAMIARQIALESEEEAAGAMDGSGNVGRRNEAQTA
ncbi:aromatic ring-hydroxylating dioxygenase subunit alpha [Eoetvoesiella caeni]|uniref:Vanillate O-demethylase monooxygenase subunit n=1 Tax=Eoetvoesiella caeni TaxID=645616 RepID=A0A366HHH5_9BURK|nr:aromatic ring-hydroxylating dioxygenase subunit alpha [Eoetvoesiella caeni]MCI2808189.1 aromatic ring-hydroxylating dioxygenase subunit alpha [Eoetvoesiella caeni]NYT53808.1 aromatic ring-hydroxylating dioxygenase subunit alpha [Eoetvoesiella caeni]RBP42114.1 vanillate O-demethylase monooxygenase subunit [Eoetvoesiella caeni]